MQYTSVQHNALKLFQKNRKLYMYSLKSQLFNEAAFAKGSGKVFSCHLYNDIEKNNNAIAICHESNSLG